MLQKPSGLSHPKPTGQGVLGELPPSSEPLLPFPWTGRSVYPRHGQRMESIHSLTLSFNHYLLGTVACPGPLGPPDWET